MMKLRLILALLLAAIALPSSSGPIMISGARSSTTPADPGGGGDFGYVSALSLFEVARLATTTSGNDTIEDVTPSEWQGTTNCSTGLESVIIAYSGGDKYHGDVLTMFGGGHGDCGNNGVYRYDFSGTTEPAGLESPLVISAQASVRSQPTLHTDGAAWATHTYDGFVRVGDFVYTMQGAAYSSGSKSGTWRFDTTATAVTGWQHLTQIPCGSETNRVHAIADEATGKIYVSCIAGADGGYFYDTAADTYSSLKDDGASEVDEYKSWIRGGSETLVIGDGMTRRYTINFSGSTVSGATITWASGAPAIADETGPSGCYFAGSGKYYVWLGQNDTIHGNGESVGYTTLYEITPNGSGSWSYTSHTLTGAASTMRSESNDGTVASWGRVLCIEGDSGLEAMGTVVDVDAPAYVVRVH